MIAPILLCIVVFCSACHQPEGEDDTVFNQQSAPDELSTRVADDSLLRIDEEKTMTPRLEAVFCYDFRALTGSVLADIIQQGIGFEPGYVTLYATDARFNLRNGKWDSTGCLNRIRAAAEVDGLLLGTEPDGHVFHFVSRPDLHSDVIFLTLPSDQMPTRNVLDHWSSLPDFHVGYLADHDYTKWQSEEMLSSYEDAAKSTKELRTYGHEPILFVDISENPGRRTEFPGFFLQAAWRMWFGPVALAHISVDRIRAIDQPIVMEWLDHGALFCQLYADSRTFETPDARDLQRRFREASGMDQLENQAPKLFADIADPVYEINHGIFEHGGTVRLTTWLDENEQPVTRSKATQSSIIECDRSGNRVWSGNVDR